MMARPNRRIGALAVAAALLTGGQIVAAGPAHADTLTANTWQELVDDFAGAVGPHATRTVVLGMDNLTDPATGIPALKVPSLATITLDLNGNHLVIDNAAPNQAGIELPADATLIIEDTSAGHDGSLMVTGGTGQNTPDGSGGGAGIGGNGGFVSPDEIAPNGHDGDPGGTLIVTGGTVTALGGPSDGEGGGGAGVGGGGGSAAEAGDGPSGGAGGAVTVTGGALYGGGGGSADGSGGAGIGGGGGGVAEGARQGPGGAPGSLQVGPGATVVSASSGNGQGAPVQDLTSTAVVASPNPAPAGAPVMITATVAVNPGFNCQLGTVLFADGGNAIGPAVPTDAQGTASITTASLSAGAHDVTATFSPNDTHDCVGSTGTASVTITAAPGGPVPNPPPGDDVGGRPGLNGPVGPQGHVGNNGPVGNVGHVGNNGPTGTVGHVGNNGPTGTVGHVGNNGPVGPQ